MIRAAALALLIGTAVPCQAATVTMDISNLAGFTFMGAGGTSGNGALSISPKYSFNPGTTVDFGTATLYGDPTDTRYGCQFGCFGLTGAMRIYWLTDGVGGFPPGVFDLGVGSCAAVPGTEWCAPTIVQLLLTVPPGNDGMQLAFQGRLKIDAPAQVPLPAGWLLFVAGLGVTSLFRRTQQ